jgi:uncharacterized coiled-coil DUF342 family protein
MSEQVEIQVREGVWLTRDGAHVEVQANHTANAAEFPWRGMLSGVSEIWHDDGRWRISGGDHYRDLVQYVGPLPVQLCAGIWKTRSGHEVEVRENIGRLTPDFPWRGALFDSVEIWRNNGRWMNEMHYDHRDLVEYVGPLPAAEAAPEPEPTPEPRRVMMRAGLWQTRDGREIIIRPRDFGDAELEAWQWYGTVDGRFELFCDDGRHTLSKVPQPLDLVQFLCPLLEVAPEPEPLPQQTTTDTLAEIEEQAGETLQTALGRALEQAYIADLKNAIDAVTTERDRLQQAHQTMTEHSAELLESAQQARDERDNLQQQLEAATAEGCRFSLDLYRMTGERDNLKTQLATMDSLEQQLAATTAERDNLAQRLWTKPSEEALQKRVAKQNIEINTLEDRLQDMTDDRETLRRQFEAMTADWDGLQAELAIAIESLQNERFQAQTAHAGCKRAEELLADMTAERDRLAAEATDAQRLAADLRGEVDFVRGQKTAQEHQLRAEIARLERGWRQAQIDLDAERETPAANCRAVVDAHLIGAQTGRQAAFEAVERWLEPLAAVDSEHAAAVLQALPGCIRKLAELEGVTL